MATLKSRFLILGLVPAFLATTAFGRLNFSNSTRDQRITGRSIAADSRNAARYFSIQATQFRLDAARTTDPVKADALRLQATQADLQANELRRSADSLDSTSFKDIALPLLAAGGIVGAAVAIGASGSDSSTPPSTYQPPPAAPKPASTEDPMAASNAAAAAAAQARALSTAQQQAASDLADKERAEAKKRDAEAAAVRAQVQSGADIQRQMQQGYGMTKTTRHY